MIQEKNDRPAGIVPDHVERVTMDEFCAGITPKVERGLIRITFYADGIIPLLVDLEYVKSEDATDVCPGSDESAEVCNVWHKGEDIYALCDQAQLDEMVVQLLESGLAGEADEGEDDQDLLAREWDELYGSDAP
jgi:hypothetical protein